MKKRGKLAALLLALMLCVGGCDTGGKEFQFPDLSSLDGLKSIGDKIGALQIPTDVLKNLSTKDLLDTILSFPLLSEILSKDGVSKAIDLLSGSFNGLKEFLGRSDVKETLENAIANIMKSQDINEKQLDFLKGLLDKVNQQEEKSVAE